MSTRQGEPVSLSIDDNRFLTESFQPAFNKYREFSTELSLRHFVRFCYVQSLSEVEKQLVTERSKAVRSPEVAPFLKKAQDVKRAHRKASHDFESKWRRGQEGWEAFWARSEVEPELIELKSQRNQLANAENTAREEFNAALNDMPNVKPLVLLQMDYTSAIQDQDDLSREASQKQRAFSREMTEKNGPDFWQKGRRLIEQKQATTLAEKRRHWEIEKHDPHCVVSENTFFSSPSQIETPHGNIAFAIEAGVPKPDDDAGKPNEDRVFIRPATNEHPDPKTIIIGIDGMGGMGKGDLAAEVMARKAQLLTSTGNEMAFICNQASQDMWDVGVENGGVCMAAATVDNDDLEVVRIGDVRVIVVREGKQVYATKDQGHLNEVANVVSGVFSGNIEPEHFTLQPNDVVAVFSDGVSDNMNPDHYFDIAYDPTSYNLDDEMARSNERVAKIIGDSESLGQAVSEIGNTVIQEMGHDRGKKDNLLLILYQHKPSKLKAN